MIRLYTASDLPDAYLLLRELERADIEARVFNENAQGGVGEIPFLHALPEIWLMDESDVGRARLIVARHEQRPRDAAPVSCPACGESNPGTFELCWKCGADL
jgi:hypothetical protein